MNGYLPPLCKEETTVVDRKLHSYSLKFFKYRATLKGKKRGANILLSQLFPLEV